MIETILDNEILVCNEPEFEHFDSFEASVDYFVVCKKSENLIGTIEAYKHLIAGEKIVSWVARACENAKILEINDYQNEISAVLPNLSDAKYTVVLKGNIPLLNKQHLKNLIGFVARKNMNACKLKGGYVFNTEYLNEVGDVLSADCYNLATNDFFEVKTFDDLEFARREIAGRIANYHSKNGVSLRKT